MTKPDVHVHDQRFDGDDPYLVCSGCGERWDALTGRAVRAVPVMTKPDSMAECDTCDHLRGEHHEQRSWENPIGSGLRCYHSNGGMIADCACREFVPEPDLPKLRRTLAEGSSHDQA